MGVTKLSKRDVLEIRIQAAEGANHAELAARFGITLDYAHQIIYGRHRTDVPVISDTAAWHSVRQKVEAAGPEILRLFHEGKPLEEIRVAVGLSSLSSVIKLLKKHNLSARSRNRAPRDAAEAQAVALFHSGNSLLETAVATHLTAKQVQTIWRLHNLRRRSLR